MYHTPSTIVKKWFNHPTCFDVIVVVNYPEPMLRKISVAFFFLVPVAALIWAGREVGDRAQVKPVYTLAQVQAGLSHNPQVWMGQTVRVRAAIYALDDYGTAIRGQSSRYYNLLAPLPGSRLSIILGPDASRHARPSTSYPAVRLVVSPRAPDALASLLRHLPLIRNIVPVPDFDSTPQNVGASKIFVLQLLPRGRASDALLFDVQ